LLAKKDDILVHTEDNAVYRVLTADKERFFVCKMSFNAKTGDWDTDYSESVPFDNQAESLEAIGFEMASKKIYKGEIVER